jgi:hypothetical protein
MPENVESAHPIHRDCPSLPPLDIEAATSTKAQRKLSEWSLADSTSTAAEKSVQSSIMDDPQTAVERTSLGQDIRYMEKHSTATQLLERSSSSLRPSSVTGKSISDVTMPLPAVPLPTEDPGRVVAMSLLRKVALIIIACSAQFLNLGGMNQTVAPVVVLADYFQIRDYGTLSWFSAAYSMTVGTFMLPAGKAHDFYISPVDLADASK